jgi:glutathione S-transferase
MITLYAAHGFPPFLKGIVRDHRVRWALEELALPYQCHWVDAGKGEQREAPNRLINPFGKMPSLENGALRMFESGAIVLYLYEHAGKAPQDAHARAELNQWCFAALNTVEPSLVEIFRLDMSDEANKKANEKRRAELVGMAHQRMEDLERALGAKPFLLGNAFGAADILMCSVLDFLQHDPSLYEKHAGVRAYRDRCHARPAHIRALAKHGEGPKANAA